MENSGAATALRGPVNPVLPPSLPSSLLFSFSDHQPANPAGPFQVERGRVSGQDDPTSQEGLLMPHVCRNPRFQVAESSNQGDALVGNLEDDLVQDRSQVMGLIQAALDFDTLSFGLNIDGPMRGEVTSPCVPLSPLVFGQDDIWEGDSGALVLFQENPENPSDNGGVPEHIQN